MIEFKGIGRSDRTEVVKMKQPVEKVYSCHLGLVSGSHKVLNLLDAEMSSA